MIRHLYLAASIAAATIVSSVLPAVAIAETAAPRSSFWHDTGRPGPLNVVVSIPDQRAYIYRGPVLIAATTVSTGKEGKETPEGRYTVLQKAIDHHSNKYDDAPMPYMQRLTWDGLALHAGYDPGYPASHGCVRMPAAFAKRLYAITRVGTRVVVTNDTVDAGAEAAALIPDSVVARERAAAADRAETARANAAVLAETPST